MPAGRPTLTQAKLKEVMHYCPDTGAFTWLVRPSNRVKIGDLAGFSGISGYRQIRYNGALYQAHRLAVLYMTGTMPSGEIDHINGNPSDNRYQNLREVSHTENQRNQKRYKTNTSGIAGVSWCRITKKWKAQIKIGDTNTYLGVFKDIAQAAGARKKAEISLGYHVNHGRAA